MAASNVQTYDFTDILKSVKHGFEIMAQGSEAKLYSGTFLGRSAILKERFVKKYRHPDLDQSLTTERIKMEVRGIGRCFDIDIKCPAVFFVDMTSRCIVLEKIEDSITVKLFLENIKNETCEAFEKLTPLATKIGYSIAKMHKNNLMHGDLTTSNMLLKNEQLENVFLNSDFDLYFIDFGLSRKNINHDDRAVDLYVLERALVSSHPGTEKFYQSILNVYFGEMDQMASAVAQKLNEVRLRGRKRSMVG